MLKKLIDVITLFCSTGTLLCCALPVLLATLAGSGAVVTLLVNVPGFIYVGIYKDWIFLLAGIMLSLNGLLMLHAAKQPCPIAKKDACQTGKAFSKWMYLGSVAVFCVGGWFAYVMPLLS